MVLSIITALLALNGFVSILVVILDRKEPQKTIAWLLVILFLPIIGLVLYMFLGRNWKLHKLNSDSNKKMYNLINGTVDDENLDYYKPLIKLIAHNSESPIFLNNEVTILKNAEIKFKTLKEELLKAKHHIHLEYFIVKPDKIGNEIADILIAKAKEGVKIRFIMDRLGSNKAKRTLIPKLKKAGVEILIYEYFLAPVLRPINTQINHRNHRKIVIIDGRVGFTGGINIGDEYLGKGHLGFWRDTHIMVKGSFVFGLQSTFLDDYLTFKKANRVYTSLKDKFDFNSYFPKAKKNGNVPMQLVKSGPESEFPSIMHSMIKMMSIAKKSIKIVTPYFVPSESFMDTIKIAAIAGIDIEIMHPFARDHIFVHEASMTYLSDLARLGVKIYFYKPSGFLHSKFITIDDEISTVGTTNIDIRSFFLNYEVNAIIYNKEITKILNNHFEEDKKDCIPMTFESFENITKLQKFKQGFSRLFSSLL